MNKCIVIKEPGKIEFIEKEVPSIKKGEALLKVIYGGICGSDLGIYRGTFAYASYPRIPGHEFSAKIVEISKNDRGLKEGMIVTANPYFNCGKCYSCRRGLVNCCIRNQTLGVQRDGVFAQYVKMPIERIYDGKGLSAKNLALIEPFSISFHGVKRANIKPRDKVLIMGAGTIGVLAMISAKQLGAEVFISDIAQEKLDYAVKIGADGVILNKDPEVFKDEVNEITEGDGFDVAIEAVGLPSTFQNCIDAVAFGGRIVLIGIGNTNLDFNFTLIQKKELNIYGSRNALKEDFDQLINLIGEGKINLEKLISNVYSANDAKKAFDEFDKRSGNMLKVLLRF